MYRKNTAGQFICVQMLLTATGAVATGLTLAARRCLDGTFAAGGGTFTEDGTTGSYKYALAQADTNANNVSIIVTGTGAIPVCVNFVTTAADPTNAATFGITDIDATISSRMATYTQPTGFLAATFPSGTVANTTNITAGTITTVTTLTNLPSIPANWLTAAGINAAALNGKGDWSTVTPTNLTAAQIATGVWQDTTAGDFTTALSVGKSLMNGVALGTGLTVNDITTKTGYSLSGTQTFNNTGTWTGNIVGTLSTLTTYTGNTVQTGDAYARLGAPAGASTAADIAAINAKTTNLPAAPASTTNITAAAGCALTAAYDFAKGTVAMTESYAANTVAPTPVQALFAIQQHLMDFAISGTSYTVFKLDHVTTAYIGTLDSAVTPTSQVRT